MADTPPVPPAGSSSVTPPPPPDAVQTVTEGIANIAASAPDTPNFSFNFEPNTGPLGQAAPNVVEDDEEYDEEDEGDMPPEMIRRVVYLQDQHEAKMKIQEVSAANTRVVDKSVITRKANLNPVLPQEYLKERAELEQKFAARYSELFAKRMAVVSGEMDDEIDKLEEDGLKAEAASSGSTSPVVVKHSADKIVGCPQFWVCAISQHDTIAETLSEADVDCLEYLRDISSTDHIDGKGFTLKFMFGEVRAGEASRNKEDRGVALIVVLSY
jgi:hypothetical protein